MDAKKFIIDYFGLPDDVSLNKVPKVHYGELVEMLNAFQQQALQQCNVVGSGDVLPDEDDEDYYEPEQQCSACCMVGGHMQECPEDESPFAQLIRDGYD